MTKEHLQNLVDVHNALYTSTVTGPSIVPVAQSIVRLQNVIEALSKELTAAEENKPTTVGDGE